MINLKNSFDLIKKYEGFKKKAYQLPGENFYTIGYGTAKIYQDGTLIKKDDIITKKKQNKN